MSSISSIGAGLAQFFQSNSQVTVAQASPGPVVTDTSADAQTEGAQQTQGAHRHHHHAHGEQFAKIKDAVTSALQSAKDDPSADPNKTVEDAIAKVLGGGGSDSTAATANGAATNGNPVANSTTDATDAKQGFAQLLQSFGVSAQQFHQDFQAALKDAQGGNVDPSTALKSFPPGLSLDETA